jgi:DHA3 family macrolide efflux protein-like MFS transporter
MRELGNLQGSTQPDRSTFRSYLLFWSGQLVSLLGSSISQFVIIWWITLETESTLYLALASVLGLAPIVILGPLAGVLADRWNRKLLILAADLFQALTTLALISLFWFDVVAIWQVLVLLTLKGVFQAFHMPSVFAIIPTMVPKDRLSRMNGVNYLFTSAINRAGPVVAALLLDLWTITQILWIDVVTFLVALAPLLIIRIPSVLKEQDKSSFRRQFEEGFGFIRNARGLLPLIMLATAVNLLLTPLGTLLPYYVKFDHFGTASDLAFVIAFIQGGMLAGGSIMSIIKVTKRKTTIIASSMYVLFLGYILIALTPTGLFWFMATSGFIQTFCIPMIDVLAMTILQTVVPVEIQGRVTSVTVSLAHAAQPIGMFLSGIVTVFIGTANFFLGCAGLGLMTLTLSWFFTEVRYVEELEENPTKEIN